MAQKKEVYIRKLRHWKQRFDKNAKFICRRPMDWDDKKYLPGDDIPKGLEENKGKLRRFWESQWIELAEFETPDVTTGRPHETKPPEGVTVEPGKGSWFVVTAGEETYNVNGQKALDKMLDELCTKMAAESDAEDTDPTEDLAEDMLIGSSILKSTYDIEGEVIQLGDIVALAFEHSELTINEWNALEQEARETVLAQSLTWMRDQGQEEQEDDDDWLDGKKEDKSETETEADG